MREPLLQTQYFMSETDPGRIVPSRAEVAFVGRSNVGKSSLICAVCQNNKLARVSKKPGRTRAINVFEVVRGKWLVDLPGYGFAEGPEREREYWPKMIGMTLSGRPNMKCVYVLIDAERGIAGIDLSLLDWLRENKIPFALVGTKVDAVSSSRHKEFQIKMAQGAGVEADELFWVSAKKGYGLKELRQDIIRALEL